MELFLITDIVYQASPKSITAVMPYFGYSRQDRKFSDQPISRNVIFKLLASVGVSSVITLDIHSDNYIKLPIKLYNIDFMQIFLQTISSELSNNDALGSALIVSPDHGSGLRARSIAQQLGLESSVLSKTRFSDGSCLINCANRKIFKNKHCILVDDMVNSANTLVAAADFLHTSQAKSISAYITHGIFSWRALEIIERSRIQKLYITDSIKQQALLPKKITTIQVSDIISNFIKSI